MHVKRFDEAVRYDAPNHRGFMGLRLQGFEPGGPTNQWVGVSHFLPGGGAGPELSPFEKVYVCLAGSVCVIVDGKEVILNALDSVTIAANETREIINRQNHTATTLVVMPYPAA